MQRYSLWSGNLRGSVQPSRRECRELRPQEGRQSGDALLLDGLDDYEAKVACQLTMYILS